MCKEIVADLDSDWLALPAASIAETCVCLAAHDTHGDIRDAFINRLLGADGCVALMALAVERLLTPLGWRLHLFNYQLS